MDRRRPGALQRALSPLRDFLHMEAAGGVLLIVGALLLCGGIAAFIDW